MMGSLGLVHVGRPAPDFHCNGVIRGLMEEVTLSTFISEKRKQWLILLFIPGAFSFVCPTEVLAFQNCFDEFKDRNCEVCFVSVDTKHSLWHWQNMPRQYGGLGQIDMTLLSDASHRMSRDYGVLIEEEGICLRGMFIIDDAGIVQQVTLNNLTVGRSVLEALRLLEAFQAVAKHGVLCPIDWKPNTNTSETISTISNTFADSYAERFSNLQKEFGDTIVTDLDAKHAHDQKKRQTSQSSDTKKIVRQGSSSSESRLTSKDILEKIKDMLVLPSPASSTTPASATTSTQTNPATNSTFSTDPHKSPISSSLSSLTTTPTPTPPITQPNPTKKHNIGTAHHSCGHASIIPHPLYRNNTWESRRGSHVILEFADPTCSPPTRSSPNTTPGTTDSSHAGATTTALRSSHAAVRNGGRSATPDLPGTPGPMTRLQTTFEVIKKMGGNLGSPRIDFGAKKAEEKDKGGGGGGRGADGWGYFDALPEPVDAGDKY